MSRLLLNQQCPLNRKYPSTVCTDSRRHALCPPSRKSASSRRSLIIRAIGFAFGDEAPERSRGYADAGRNADSLSKAPFLASSLYLYQAIFKGSVGEAFLTAISISKKSQATNKDVIAAYARFYSLLVTAGYDDWPDYLLDQVLLARDNPLARAIAVGGVDTTSPLLKALAYDLDTLQALCVPLEDIAAYMNEVAPVVKSSWVEAGSSAAARGAGAKGVASTSGPQPGLNLNMPQRFISRPPSSEELASWKATLANQRRWGDASSIVRQYYHLHGYGITSRNTTLRWSKGALEEVPEREPLVPTVPHLSAAAATVSANTRQHADGNKAASHVLVVGGAGVGKTTLVWDVPLAVARETGLRVVDVSASELPNLLDIARGCGRYPRVRFLLVADNVEFPLRGALAADVLAGLSGAGAAHWPDNTLLYVGATADSTISPADPVVSRFGLLTVVPPLVQSSFLDAVQSIARKRGVETEVGLEALTWAGERQLPLSLTTAALYVATLI